MKFKAYGLIFETDIPLQNLPPAEGTADVKILLTHHPLEASSDPSELEFVYPITKAFVFKIDGPHTMYIQCKPDIPIQRLQLFLMTLVMCALMQMRHRLTLHANVLTKNGSSAILIVGKKRAGKSTLSAELCKKGYRLLSDDIAPIDVTHLPTSIPSYPKLNLWQDAIDRLDFHSNLKVQLGKSDKFQLILNHHFFDRPLPIEAIYEINPEWESLTSVKGKDKLDLLMDNTFRFSFVKARKKEKEYMAQLMTLSSQVPCFRANRDHLLDILS